MTENAPQLAQSVPSDHELTVYNTMAKQAVDSNMYRGIGKESGIMMIMLAARELGIPAMQALNGGLHIIQGRVEISARMMSALIRRAGHSVQIKESSGDKCVLVGKRADNGDEGTATFTMKEANQAGLVKKGGGWEKFPGDMLYARALSRLARQLFADVVGVGYVEGEITPQKSNKCDSEPLQEADCEVQESADPKKAKKARDELMKSLDKEDQMRLVEYHKKACSHYGWSEDLGWLKIQGEGLDKFESWKEKQK